MRLLFWTGENHLVQLSSPGAQHLSTTSPSRHRGGAVLGSRCDVVGGTIRDGLSPGFLAPPRPLPCPVAVAPTPAATPGESLGYKKAIRGIWAFGFSKFRLSLLRKDLGRQRCDWFRFSLPSIFLG